ncbi:hypothetical protein D3C71_1551010 [compost metagenome]
MAHGFDLVRSSLDRLADPGERTAAGVDGYNAIRHLFLGIVHQCRRFLHFTVDGLDHISDFTGRFLGLLSQLANLRRDDCEAPALFAGTRGFNRSVKSQQIGLAGDAHDQLDNPADAFTPLVQVPDHRA